VRHHTLQVGAAHLTLCLDARGTLAGDRLFHPATREEWSPGLQPNGQGELPIVVAPMLIEEDRRYTLVDTGFGEEGKPGRAENLLDSLAGLGVGPDDIERVILTHAHGDHIMGNTCVRGGRRVPTFPRAEYVIQRLDYEATREAMPRQWGAYLHPLQELGRLRLLDGAAELSDTLACWPTPGHTIGHQAVLVRSGGARALHVGDLMIYPRNVERPEWGPVWAWSHEVDTQSRSLVAEWAADSGGVLVLSHHPDTPFVMVKRWGNGYSVHPAAGPTR